MENLAILVIEAAEAVGIEFMTVGAIAAGAYGVPRATRDVDLLISVQTPENVDALIGRLVPLMTFDKQVTFDTLTWADVMWEQPTLPLLSKWNSSRHSRIRL